MKSALPLQGATSRAGIVDTSLGSWTLTKTAHHQQFDCCLDNIKASSDVWVGEGRLPGVWDTVCSQHGTGPQKCKAPGHESCP